MEWLEVFLLTLLDHPCFDWFQGNKENNNNSNIIFERTLLNLNTNSIVLILEGFKLYISFVISDDVTLQISLKISISLRTSLASNYIKKMFLHFVCSNRGFRFFSWCYLRPLGVVITGFKIFGLVGKFQFNCWAVNAWCSACLGSTFRLFHDGPSAALLTFSYVQVV